MRSLPVVLAPNAFKGTLTAVQAAAAMAMGVERACPGRLAVMRPLPDGGDGTLETLLPVFKAERRFFEVSDACGRPRTVPFGLTQKHSRRIAIIESAPIIGPGDGLDCPFASRGSEGLGQLIRHALDLGAQTLYIGLGGSATCDAGLGLLTALGVRWRGSEGRGLADLGGVVAVDSRGLDPRLKRTRIVVFADVVNPLLGAQGAALFAAQKGANAQDLARIEGNLGSFATCLEAHFGRSARHVAGSGAAGGLGFALALLSCRIVPGARALARLTGLQGAIRAAGLVLTGEGACDEQTAYGKGPRWVAEQARSYGKPCYLVCGRIAPSFAPHAALFSGCVRLAPADSAFVAVADAVAQLMVSCGL